jgi:predicted 2-oxoglutarate/Fe(II)-dependent dioxygenase YbiX
MSKRLQVLFEDAEMEDLQDAARRRRISVSEWVRGAVREAHRREARGDMASQLDAVRAATRHEFPTADVDEMLAEIERGYMASAPE